MSGAVKLSKNKHEGFQWKKIKKEILGAKYDLSLVFADAKTALHLNKKYRKKNKPANTLSFVLGPDEGEIFLNGELAEKEILRMYIHSLLHLKGMRHGEKMEKEEDKYLKKFKKTN
jgi:ssRNA-specific RNase YbeY (16S rRNA maturation enzyme)